MFGRQLLGVITLSLLSATFMGCESSTPTSNSTAPEGHDGKALGKQTPPAAAPAEPKTKGAPTR